MLSIHRRTGIMVGALLCVVTLGGIWWASGPDKEPITSGTSLRSQGLPPGSSLDESNPKSPTYPAEWRRTLAEARRSFPFPFLLPDHPRANRENLTHVFLRPDRLAVMLDFPPPTDNGPPVRQQYIEITFTPWDSEGDPDVRFAEYVATNPVDGRRIEYMDGRVVLIQEGQSSDDAEGANEALIRFVKHGLDIQISGSDNVGLLKQIAETLQRS